MVGEFHIKRGSPSFPLSWFLAAEWTSGRPGRVWFADKHKAEAATPDPRCRQGAGPCLPNHPCHCQQFRFKSLGIHHLFQASHDFSDGRVQDLGAQYTYTRYTRYIRISSEIFVSDVYVSLLRFASSRSTMAHSSRDDVPYGVLQRAELQDNRNFRSLVTQVSIYSTVFGLRDR